ncbi:hypothetical protein Q1695_014618 [Nippostrongylus brasiliensis]|nr:hypothetical protein Q1695_014618 [Nippostrongylus brasiliensis]
MWLALGAKIYLVAGPRTTASQQWLQVAEKTRQHIETYMQPQHRENIIDKLPAEAACMEWNAPCFVLGVVEVTGYALLESEARKFYAACATQLKPWLEMEPAPNQDHPAKKLGTQN